MEAIKFRYTCIRENGHTFYRVFTLEQIESSEVRQWWECNHIGKSILHKDQFTGLIDKNGKEIYEGDIVILSNVLADGDKKICKAIIDGWQSIFESVENGFYCFMGNTAQNYREVIGNIYENPELMPLH